ncbi:MAG: hypothetical protein J2P28_10910, partial [Actinobacteria bacterium]|nr:hypothetical protein [Actinomycetota bacterium]
MKAARRRIGTAAAQPRPDGTPPGTDSLPQIEHIIVLMMENHSYDNYLGMLQGRGDGFTVGPDGKPVGANPSVSGAEVPLWTTTQTTQEKR